MWISKRTDYATRAVLALVLADEDQLKLDELARRTAVPASVLEQVMPVLRSAGIVRSERGAHGGYRLNRPPAEISLERVVRLFEGPLAPIGCATRSQPEPCPMSVGCSLRFVWEEVRDATITALGNTSFAELAARAGGRWREAAPSPSRPLGRSKQGVSRSPGAPRASRGAEAEARRR